MNTLGYARRPTKQKGRTIERVIRIEVKPHAPIISLGSLCSMFGVSRKTVRDVCTELCKEECTNEGTTVWFRGAFWDYTYHKPNKMREELYLSPTALDILTSPYTLDEGEAGVGGEGYEVPDDPESPESITPIYPFTELLVKGFPANVRPNRLQGRGKGEFIEDCDRILDFLASQLDVIKNKPPVV